MRRIVERHVLIDGAGFAWEAEVSIPWVDRPDDAVKYGRDKPIGDPRPLITLHTPNDPEHPLYGEDGPRFDLSSWAVVALLARRHEPVTP